MKRSIRILARARSDINSVFDWLGHRSLQGAIAWYDAFLETIERISKNPESRSIVAEASPRWNRKIHQEFFRTPRGRRYRIIFEWTGSEIIILRVRAPGQRPVRLTDLPRE